jgi:hypothetical protein
MWAQERHMVQFKGLTYKRIRKLSKNPFASKRKGAWDVNDI